MKVTLLSFAFLLVLLQLESGEAANSAPVCWKAAYGRGVGKPISSCDASKGLEKSGALCYPFCKNSTVPTYYGIGPVCWQHCKEGYIDEGALCRRKGSIVTYAKKSYGRGAGYPLTCAAGQQYDAGLCYDCIIGGLSLCGCVSSMLLDQK